ncbi:MAG: hypothetical protein ACOC40_02695 [Thermoplasmatota archaeon]
MAFESHFDEFRDAVKEQINSNMQEVVDEYQELLKRKLDTPPARTGRVYYIWPYGRHTASRGLNPSGEGNEPPAPLSRGLINSIEQSIISKEPFNGIVYSNLNRALILELGTGERYTKGGQPRGKINPRPAWVKTLVENRDKLGDIATQGFKKG